jgi:hypothetical protein
MGHLFCGGNWTKWGSPFKSYGGDNFQARECDKCGAISLKLIVGSSRAQVTPSQITDSLKMDDK